MSSAPLWTWPKICAALGLPAESGPEVLGLTIDSRRVTPGDLFVALPGDPGPHFQVSQRSLRDGHDYIDAAMAAGAVGVLAHDGIHRNIPQLQTTDTFQALWSWARAARARLHCPVIAVTGSSGKTTTKRLLAAALDGFCTAGSFNNHIGVPLSLITTPEKASAAVFEIGTSYPGEIAPLAELVGADVALVLNVHPAHVEFFRDLHALSDEKCSIYKGLRREGHLVLEDLVDASSVPADITTSTFGRTEAADVRLCGLGNGLAQYRVDDAMVSAAVPGGGTPQALCVASSLAVLRALGRDLVGGLTLTDDLIPAGRGNVMVVGGVSVVDDSYNANPESMKAALDSLAVHDGPTLAVLGDMLELGTQAAHYHAELLGHCGSIDGVICVGPEMNHLYNRLPPHQRVAQTLHADDALLEAIVAHVRPNYRVLVKGSNRIFWTGGFVDRLRTELARSAH